MQFEPGHQTVRIRNETSVLEVALKNNVRLPHSCGGMGSCTTCRIFVVRSPQPLPERGELETEIAESRGFASHERLACQLPPTPGLEVRIPEILAADFD